MDCAKPLLLHSTGTASLYLLLAGSLWPAEGLAQSRSKRTSEDPPPSTALKHGPSGFVFSGLYPLDILGPRRVQKGSP